MKDTPKSLRLQIGLFGRTNVGKSSFLNMVAGQDYAITSVVPGTTTDVVEKTMELLPVGPVVFLDTAGIDDVSELSSERLKKTRKILDRADVAVLIVEPDVWSKYEETMVAELGAKKIPVIIAVNKTDVQQPSDEFMEKMRAKSTEVIACSSTDKKNRDKYVNLLKEHLIKLAPDNFLNPKAIIGDIVPAGGLAFLIIPIDFEAPKGRIILPQVQIIRDLLDFNSASLVAKESEYRAMLKKLKTPPDIVVCDSQVVDKMVADTPDGVKCTTFSILFSRYKGDLEESVKGVFALDKIGKNDKILIAEACSHHPIEGDIGRIKMPKWIEKYLGFRPKIDVSCGRDYPENLSEYKLVIHCGACMITRREMLGRIEKCKAAGVAITNYGVCISYMFKVLDRVLEPFEEVSMSLRGA
ncbi:MAG: [FeFe] hydrogenase H-cluster maturation GTPase HydF [Candidatus Margulisiibacteriota bacterium]